MEDDKMNKVQFDIITNLARNLTNIDPDNGLRVLLLSSGILNWAQLEAIYTKEKNPTSGERVIAILEKLVKGPQINYAKFRYCLREIDRGDIVDKHLPPDMNGDWKPVQAPAAQKEQISATTQHPPSSAPAAQFQPLPAPAAQLQTLLARPVCRAVTTYVRRPIYGPAGSGDRCVTQEATLLLDVSDGPADDRIIIKHPEHTVTGNFTYSLKINDMNTPRAVKQDMVHTFAVAAAVARMYDGDLMQLKKTLVSWRQKKELQIYPHGNPPGSPRENAEYQVANQLICCGYTEDELQLYQHLITMNTITRQNTFYVCRIHDVVAHEVGHAVLDQLQPEWFPGDLFTLALHESFGDLTAIFLQLSTPGEAEHILRETNRNLKAVRKIDKEIQDFRRPRKLMNGVFNAGDDRSLTDAKKEHHDLGMVFTGAVYYILDKMFEIEDKVGSTFEESAKLLECVASTLRMWVVRSFIESSRQDAVFLDVATKMIECAEQDHGQNPNDPIVTFMKKEFDRRKLMLTRAQLLANILPNLKADDNPRPSCLQ